MNESAKVEYIRPTRPDRWPEPECARLNPQYLPIAWHVAEVLRAGRQGCRSTERGFVVWANQNPGATRFAWAERGRALPGMVRMFRVWRDPFFGWSEVGLTGKVSSNNEK